MKGNIMQANRFPDFFQQAPVLRIQDPLAEFLGASEQGLLEYRYEDAVKLCGHSCPTVAGACLMVVKGLQALYGDDIPQRGDMEAAMQGQRDEGTTGVTAAVVQLLTGAAPETGFGGIGMQGRFARRNLLQFGADIKGTLLLRRKDTGQAVSVHLNSHLSPFAEEMRALLPKAVGSTATPEEHRRFGELWQARVKAFLIDLADDPQFIEIEKI